MDEATQFGSILRDPKSHLSWTEKVVTQGLKALVVNAFIFWRIRQMRRSSDEMENLDCYSSLESNRHQVNEQGSLGDHVLDMCTQLLVYATELRKSGSATAATAMLSSTGNGGSQNRKE